jgi:enoyl-CoA hydratase/carnithine racemase
LDPLVCVNVEGPVATIRLNDPPRNRITLPMATALHGAATEVTARGDVRSVVLWGGERTFSAGGNVQVMSEQSPETMRPILAALGDAVSALEAVPKVVIAAIDGLCLGGGCEIALAADFRYAGSTARLGQPEIRFGIIPGAGATQRLQRLVGRSKAKELIYSGRWVNAAEALSVGIVDYVVESGGAYPAALEAAVRYARAPAAAIAAAKAAIHAQDAGAEELLDVERDLLCGLFGTADQRENMRAFLQK